MPTPVWPDQTSEEWYPPVTTHYCPGRLDCCVPLSPRCHSPSACAHVPCWPGPTTEPSFGLGHQWEHRTGPPGRPQTPHCFPEWESTLLRHMDGGSLGSQKPEHPIPSYWRERKEVCLQSTYYFQIAGKPCSVVRVFCFWFTWKKSRYLLIKLFFIKRNHLCSLNYSKYKNVLACTSPLHVLSSAVVSRRKRVESGQERKG